MRGGGSVVVLVGVTPHRGARENRVQGEAPESGGRRSRATKPDANLGECTWRSRRKTNRQKPSWREPWYGESHMPGSHGEDGETDLMRHRALSLPTNAREP